MTVPSSSPVRSVRTLATSQLDADLHLHLAADLSGHGDRRIGMALQLDSCVASITTRDPEPAISSTRPIGGTPAFDDEADLARHRRSAVAAQLVEELLQARLIGHGRTPPS